MPFSSIGTMHAHSVQIYMKGKHSYTERRVVTHAFHLNRGRRISEFNTSLVYKAGSRTARAVTQRNPVLKHKKTFIQGLERWLRG